MQFLLLELFLAITTLPVEAGGVSPYCGLATARFDKMGNGRGRHGISVYGGPRHGVGHNGSFDVRGEISSG